MVSRIPKKPKESNRPKLLLDENLAPREHYSKINSRFNIRHIRHDYKKHRKRKTIPDEIVFEVAFEEKRIIVTHDKFDYWRLRQVYRDNNRYCPTVVTVSSNLNPKELDNKLLSTILNLNHSEYQSKLISLTK